MGLVGGSGGCGCANGSFLSIANINSTFGVNGVGGWLVVVLMDLLRSASCANTARRGQR